MKATSQTSLSGVIEIPAAVIHNDIEYAVTTIPLQGFYKCAGITSVSFPQSLKTIGERAFDSCAGLTTVEIPATITDINRGPFSNCASLTDINVDPDNENYSSENGILYNKNKNRLIQYPAGKTNTSYTIQNHVDSIDGYAFMDCHTLNELIIPESVEYIGQCAIYSCYGFTSLSIPGSVKKIEAGGFGGRCINLREINVDDANGNYCSEDGIMFNKQKNAIIVFPAGKDIEEYVVPESVDSIAPYGFSTCQHLSAITIPASIKYFDTYTFFACTQFKRFINLNPVPQTLLSTNIFNGNVPKSMTLYVPKGSKDAYSNANTWKQFTDIREIGDIMVSLNTRYVTLKVGEMVELKAQIEKNEDVDVASELWTSSDTEVATVSADGVVTAIADGTTTITVTVTDSNGNTYNDVCDITVDSTSGVSIITTDCIGAIDYSIPYKVYNLNGLLVGNHIESLAPGLYIVRQNNFSAKILIR